MVFVGASSRAFHVRQPAHPSHSTSPVVVVVVVDKRVCGGAWLGVGVFCFVGVPLFAMVLGSIAGFQIDRLMELRVQKKIERNIEVRA